MNEAGCFVDLGQDVNDCVLLLFLRLGNLEVEIIVDRPCFVFNIVQLCGQGFWETPYVDYAVI